MVENQEMDWFLSNDFDSRSEARSVNKLSLAMAEPMDFQSSSDVSITLII